MNITFNFHADPGHAWLAVKRKFLEKYVNLRDISSYSYENGGTVYLEEDCDASLFLKALRDAGIEYSFKELSTNGRHYIRSYKRFCAQ